MTGCEMTSSDVTGCEMTSSDVTGSDVTSSAMTGCEMTSSDVTGSDVTSSAMTGCEMTSSDVTSSAMTGCEVTGSAMTRTAGPPSVAAEQAGFTLLEMLAALTVLALCCSVLLTAFGQSARALQQVQRSDRLSLAARSLIDEFSLGPLTPGHSAGTWDGDLRWTLEVTRQAPGSAAAQAGASMPGNARVALYQLDLDVFEAHRHTRLSTLQVRSAGTGAQP